LKEFLSQKPSILLKTLDLKTLEA